MRNLKQVAKTCMQELNNLGIEYGYVVRWEVNTRVKKRWGLCSKVRGGFAIQVNKRLLDDDADLNGLKSTIIHELLHTCKGCWNHGAEFKRLAKIVNDAYGYDIGRTATAQQLGVKEVKSTLIRYKYIEQCTNCGNLTI